MKTRERYCNTPIRTDDGVACKGLSEEMMPCDEDLPACPGKKLYLISETKALFCRAVFKHARWSIYSVTENAFQVNSVPEI